MNVVERIVKVFYSPREVFAYLGEKPDWLVPLIILMVVSVLAVFLTYSPIIKVEQMRRFEDSSRFTQEQIEEMKKGFEGNRGLIIALAGTVVVAPIALLMVSAILFGVFSLIGGEGKYKKVLSVYSYSSLIAVLSIVIKTPLQLAKGSSQVYTSAALAVPGLSPQSTLFRILNSFDIFTLWQLWAVILGLATIYGFTTKKSAMGVLSIWAIWVVLKVGLGAVFARMS